MGCAKFTLLALLIFTVSCSSTKNIDKKYNSYHLTESKKIQLIDDISKMMELDQKYRLMITLGTMDSNVLNKEKEVSNKSAEEYLSFLQSIVKTLSPKQIDSLSNLQTQLDYSNYQKLKKIILSNGYPSKERLGTTNESAFVILLHPPMKQIRPKLYLKKMSALLLSEVKSKRMSPIMYARFVDNIKAKILGEPQLYGTIKGFDPNTMSAELPKIKNLNETNLERKKIGLEEIGASECIIVK